VVGGSYGGFASLWAVIRNPERYRCAASWAGVTDFREQLEYDKDYLDRRVGKRWRNRVSGERSLVDLDTISPAKQIARLTRPVLIAHGTRDGRVPFSQFRMFREAAATNNIPIQPLLIENEGHSFSGKHNEQKWYDTLLEFLAKHNPSDRPPPPPEKDDGPKRIKRVNSM
jgi:dipeptidyl aminopeptidase/acylaminoacyl peptidase